MHHTLVTTWQPGQLTPGTVVDTARETCTVLSRPDAQGCFAVDSGGTSPCHVDDVTGVRRHAVTVPAELAAALLAHAAGVPAGPVLDQAKADSWHRVVLPQPGAAHGAIVTYMVRACIVNVSWDGERAGEPSPNMATGDQVLSVQDEIPSMTFADDSRRAVIANAVAMWYFHCSWCRETTRARTFDGQVDLGLRGSGREARWFQAQNPGRKPVPGCCLACGEVRAFPPGVARETTGLVAGPKTLELENYAWKRFRATLPAAEVDAADRSQGIIIPRRQARAGARAVGRGH